MQRLIVCGDDYSKITYNQAMKKSCRTWQNVQKNVIYEYPGENCTEQLITCLLFLFTNLVQHFRNSSNNNVVYYQNTAQMDVII